MQSLPNELVIYIMRLATLVPEAFDTRPHNEFILPPPPSTRVIQRLITQSFETKMALSLVCSTWHRLAREFLYELILVQDPVNIAPIADLLERSKELSLSSEEGIGRWTLRVDFTFTLDGHQEWIETMERHAVRLIRCCPNLQIFVNQVKLQDTSLLPNSIQVLHTLSTTCAANLRVLECTYKSELSDAGYLRHLLSRAPSLQLLRLGHADHPTIAALMVPTSSFPPLNHLHTLEYDSHARTIMDTIPNNPDPLPALRRLELTCSRRSRRMARFFYAHGSKVQTLILPPRAFCRLADANLLQHLGAVQTLVIDVHDVPAMLEHPLPSVTNVGLRGRIVKMTKDHWNALFWMLDGQAFPKLRFIRMLDTMSAFVLSEMFPRLVIEWKTRFAEKGVRLEDSTGALISVMPSLVNPWTVSKLWPST